MENFAITFIAITAIISFMASVHTKFLFERHLFAWVSAANAVKLGLIIMGLLDNENQRYGFDILSASVLIIFATISLLRGWVPKINAIFTDHRRHAH